MLERLKEEYIASYMSADAAWYEERLADDFVCIESDGSVLDKAQFLKNTELSNGYRGPQNGLGDVSALKLEH